MNNGSEVTVTTRRLFLKWLSLMPLAGWTTMRERPMPAPAKRAVFLKEVDIAGLPYHAGADPKVLAQLTPGERLQLLREPTNQYDAMAVAIHTTRGEKLGYVPRIQNRTLARIADQGIPLRAHVVRVDQSRPAWARVRVRIEQMV